MVRVAVVTDTNSGMTVAEGAALGVFVLPMPVLIGGESYMEGVDVTHRQLFAAMRDGQEVSTSQPSPAAVTELWDCVLAQGYDELVYIPMSGGLSASCQTAARFAQEYGGRVQVADNHRISVTQKLSVLDALHMARCGMRAAQIRARLEENALNASIYIAVDTLKYLKKSGRVTPAAAAIASVMNIKPILSIQGDKLDAFDKVRGSRRCRERMIEALAAELRTRFAAFPRERVVVATAGSLETPQEEEAWRAQVQAAFPDCAVEYAPLSCSICCHTGAGAFGLGIVILDRPQADT